jgi:hypothetical protein
MKKVICLTVFLSIPLYTLLFAGQVEKDLKNKGLHLADLSEEDKVNLQVNRLEQVIQQQQIEEIEKILSPDYKEADPSVSKTTLKEELESIFSNLSQVRQFTTQTNPKTGWKVTSSQDFYIRNPEIKVEQDKAWVECDIGFFSATKNYKDLRETFSFVQTNRRWLLSGSENLFGFLENASKTASKELGTINSAGEIMLQTKDDFTSTYLLVPTILYNHGKTSIPRFNKTESLNWFGVNCMNSPYGIVADVQYVEGGPDLSYEFLFVTDVTSQKIIGSDQDDWVGEFGTEGSGVGQFWGPHGICNLPGFYFVADMFNNRVITYEYEKGWDESIWRFTLTAGFDWPIDVEAKEANPSAYPPEADYVVVADHRNHRLALFIHAYPYPFTFDRYYGEYGSGEGQFIYPTSVCFGRDPQTGWHTYDVFVTDYGNHRLVWLYLQDIEPYNVFWRATYQFPIDVDLTSVEVDNKGLVYVVDKRNAKVYKFATHPSFSFELLGIWGEKGTADGQLYYPNTIRVAHGRYCPYPDPCEPLTSLGNVFVTESWGDQTGIRRFVIGSDVLNLSAGYILYNEDTGEGNYIWYAYHLTDFASVTEQVFRGGEVCTTYNRGTLNWGSQGGDWNVGAHPHGETYTVKITANSIYDPTVVVQKTVDVYVDTMTTHNPVITRGIRCNHDNPLPFWCDDCWQCIKEGHTYTLDVQAYDPDSDLISYEWRCMAGHFTDGTSWYKQMTTSENYVCYVAPWLPKDQKGEDWEQIRVTVKDPYGGQTGTRMCMDSLVYPSSYSCLCGDVNGDSLLNINDVAYLINYLSSGGPPPPEPIKRADANNDCEVNMSDVVYLINYKYLVPPGPPPECCWIH